MLTTVYYELLIQPCVTRTIILCLFLGAFGCTTEQREQVERDG